MQYFLSLLPMTPTTQTKRKLELFPDVL